MGARRAPPLRGLLAALALAVPGCAGGEQPSTRAEGVGSAAATAFDASNDINATRRDRLQDGGTLTWPLDQWPPNFNAGHLDGALSDNVAVVNALLPSPFHFDAAGRPILNHDLVVSAELTSTDPQVVTYRVNPQARWYDGTPITVADFEAQWKARNGSDPDFHVASTQGYDKIASVAQGRNELEVVVTHREPFADWRSVFSGLYPASTNRDPAVFNRGWAERPLTSAGPFRLQRLDQAAQTITLVRNERWWGAPAKLDRIAYRVIAPDAQFDALANGEVDFVEVGPDVDKLRRAQIAPGVAIRRAAAPDYRHLTFNGTSEALGDVQVRRALALAIDRQTIARALIGPLGVPARPLNNHIFMANQAGYRDNAGDLGSPAPERAKAMLDATGWRAAGPVRTKDGKELALRLVIPSHVRTSRHEAKLVQEMLAGVGVEVDIHSVPAADFFERYITPGNFDLTLFSWVGTVFPISSATSIYAQPSPGGDGRLDVGQNYGRIGSDEIDRLFDEATAAFDRARANELGNEIDALIWQEVHSLTLYQRPEIVAAREDLANVGAFGFATLRYEDMGYLER